MGMAVEPTSGGGGEAEWVSQAKESVKTLAERSAPSGPYPALS